MKLISNFRDYYDHQIGVHGIDGMVVYERYCKDKPYHLSFSNPILYCCYILAFCGTLYVIYYYEGKFYFGDDYKNIPDNKVTNQLYHYRGEHHLYTKYFHMKSTSINEEKKCPVILLQDPRGNMKDFEVNTYNPRLSDFGFPSIMSPNDCFIAITNFILREKEITDPRTNKEKIMGHGFDYITSFRNM